MRVNNDQYGYSFNEFLNIAERASLGLKREPKPDVEGEFQEAILFNYHSSLKKYSDSLSARYLEIGPSISGILERIELKIHKLNYLTGMLAEVNGTQSLISRNEKGQFEHAYFEFVDLSDQENLSDTPLSQSDIQPYLITLNRYINMVKETIEGLKTNIDATAQSDLPVPPNLRSKPEDSTLDIPEKYFDYLIVKNGVGIIKHQFLPTDDEREGYDGISYDEKTETKTYYERNYETGDYDETKVVFSQLLLRILYKEVNNFKSLVDEKIAATKNIEEVQFYIELLVSRLKYLIEISKIDKTALKYENIHKALKACIRYVHEKYAQFCPEPDLLVLEILKESRLSLDKPKQMLLSEPKSPSMFRWTKVPNERLTFLLHDQLSGSFIEKIDLVAFAKIFEGGHPEHRPGIKWIDKSKNNTGVNKVNLLYLFKRLAEEELIDQKFESPEMVGKLGYIFVDSKGKRLKNWTQSRKSINDGVSSTPQRKEIDRIVSLLASESAI